MGLDPKGYKSILWTCALTDTPGGTPKKSSPMFLMIVTPGLFRFMLKPTAYCGVLLLGPSSSLLWLSWFSWLSWLCWLLMSCGVWKGFSGTYGFFAGLLGVLGGRLGLPAIVESFQISFTLILCSVRMCCVPQGVGVIKTKLVTYNIYCVQANIINYIRVHLQPSQADWIVILCHPTLTFWLWLVELS